MFDLYVVGKGVLLITTEAMLSNVVWGVKHHREGSFPISCEKFCVFKHPILRLT